MDVEIIFNILIALLQRVLDTAGDNVIPVAIASVVLIVIPPIIATLIKLRLIPFVKSTRNEVRNTDTLRPKRPKH